MKARAIRTPHLTAVHGDAAAAGPHGSVAKAHGRRLDAGHSRPAHRAIDPLTAVHGEVADRQHAGSYAGMAHFAATGPLGMTCGGCCSYGTADASIRNAAGEIIQTRRKPHACGKFQEISGKLGGDIPEHADACKYFEPKESAQ